MKNLKKRPTIEEEETSKQQLKEMPPEGRINKANSAVEHLEGGYKGGFVCLYIMRISKDGYEQEGYTGSIFSRRHGKHEMASKWGISYIGYRRDTNGRALMGKVPQHIQPGKKAWPWRAMIADANSFENQKKWLETFRDQLNELRNTSPDFHYESPPFVLTMCNAREDGEKRKIQDVLSETSVTEFVVEHYELHRPSVCDVVLKDGVQAVVPIETIYTEDTEKAAQTLTNYLSTVFNSKRRTETQNEEEDEEEDEKRTKGNEPVPFFTCISITEYFYS
eukprot:scaffold154_cov129-Cylindrotheca_fusiformis.AAC.7